MDNACQSTLKMANPIQMLDIFLESQLYKFVFLTASTEVKILVREIITALSFGKSKPSRQYSEFNK